MHAATLPPPGAPAAARASGKPPVAPEVSGDKLGALINLAGRQRMLSQRIVLQALLSARGQQGAGSTAREALALFTVSHAGLVHGGPQLPGAHFAAIREAYFGALQGDARIREFIALTERTLAAIEDGLRGAEALQQELVASSSPMLDLLNRLTQIYEAEAARHAVVQHQRQQALMADIQTIAKQARELQKRALRASDSPKRRAAGIRGVRHRCFRDAPRHACEKPRSRACHRDGSAVSACPSPTAQLQPG